MLRFQITQSISQWVWRVVFVRTRAPCDRRPRPEAGKPTTKTPSWGRLEVVLRPPCLRRPPPSVVAVRNTSRRISKPACWAQLHQVCCESFHARATGSLSESCVQRPPLLQSWFRPFSWLPSSRQDFVMAASSHQGLVVVGNSLQAFVVGRSRGCRRASGPRRGCKFASGLCHGCKFASGL